jgi:hypothetical protein
MFFFVHPNFLPVTTLNEANIASVLRLLGIGEASDDADHSREVNSPHRGYRDGGAMVVELPSAITLTIVQLDEQCRCCLYGR